MPIENYLPGPLSNERALCEFESVLRRVPPLQAHTEAPGAHITGQLELFGFAAVACGRRACQRFCYLEYVIEDGRRLVDIAAFSESEDGCGQA